MQLHVANPLGMKWFYTLTMHENFFECWLQIEGALLSEGRKAAWAKKKFSAIWFGAPLGKLEASTAWKFCWEGVLGKSACKVKCEVAGWAGLG